MSNFLRKSLQSGRRFRSNIAVLTEEFAGTPNVKAKAPVAAQHRTSKLQSGITLASRATDSPVVGLSVTVKSGARDETPEQWGSAFMLKHLAFQDTNDRSAFALLRDLQDVGATVSSDATRETITLKVDVLRDHVEAAVAALADSVLQPYLPEWVLNEHKPGALINVENILANPQTVATELAHEAAFGEASALGSTLYSAADIQALQHDRFVDFRNRTFVADNLVIAANGLDHGTLTSFAEAYFKSASTGRAASNDSAYVGGEVRVKTTGPLTHMALAFNGVGFNKEGYDANEVLTLLLKSKLQKESASSTAYHFGYRETGLVGVYGSAKTADASKLAASLTNALKSVANATEEEVTRAKQAISLQRTLQNEHSTCTFSLARAAAHGVDPQAFAQCRSVNKAAVQQAAQNLLRSKPAFVVLGPTGRVPRLDDITKLLK